MNYTNISNPDYSEEIIDLFNSNYNNKNIPSNCIPNVSGIYIFFDYTRNEILYIGKAKKLRNRILSYKKSKKIIDIFNYLYDNNLPDDINFAFDVFAFCLKNPEETEKKLIEFYKPKFNIHYK